MPPPKQQKTQHMALSRPIKRFIPSFNIICWISRTVSDQCTFAQKSPKRSVKRPLESSKLWWLCKNRWVERKSKRVKQQSHLLVSLNNERHATFFQFKDNWCVPVAHAAQLSNHSFETYKKINNGMQIIPLSAQFTFTFTLENYL